MATLRLGSVGDVPEGATRAFALPGGERVAVANLGDGEFHAISDICSHAHYYLSEGELDVEERTLECWKHGSTFDLLTGRPTTLPATRPVRVYPLRVEEDELLIEVDDVTANGEEATA